MTDAVLDAGPAAALGTAVETAPAKINLALHVTGRRPDRYHALETLAVFARLGDRLAVRLADRDAIAVAGPFAAAVPPGDGNIVAQARDRLRAAYPDRSRAPVAIRIDKRLPVAAGIGGGSSDAAALLRALGRLWRTPDASAVAESLGADVPMCLLARPLVATGKGEHLAPVAPFPALHLVLANPGVAVSTPAVFAALTRRDNPPLPPLPEPLDLDALLGWLAVTRNDLQDAATALAPAIGGTLAALRATGALFARMSGSGATCFGLFPTPAAAEWAASALAAEHPGWWVAATATTPSPPPARP